MNKRIFPVHTEIMYSKRTVRIISSNLTLHSKNNVEDMVVFLGLKVFISDNSENSHKFSSS